MGQYCRLSAPVCFLRSSSPIARKIWRAWRAGGKPTNSQPDPSHLSLSEGMGVQLTGQNKFRFPRRRKKYSGKKSWSEPSIWFCPKAGRGRRIWAGSGVAGLQTTSQHYFGYLNERFGAMGYSGVWRLPIGNKHWRAVFIKKKQTRMPS